MIEDAFVFNAISHAYNLRADNVKSHWGEGLRQDLYQLHANWSPPEAQVPKEVFLSDATMDVLADTLFLETDIDMAANHNLRVDSWFHDGVCSHEKNVEAATRFGDRFVTYVGVDPCAGLETCLRELDEQMQEIPNAVGLKLYPDQVEPFRSWRMDDPSLAYPLFERAGELGIKAVAIHKAIPNGPVPINPYRVDDVDGAAIHFPNLNFEIVHSGLAFVDETAFALSRFPNVYASLEITFSLLYKAPGWFNEILAVFLLWGGPEKIIYSDGSLFCHSQNLLERFWNLQFPDAVLEKYGVEQLSRDDKKKILGENYARIIGLDIEDAKQKLAGDTYSRRRAESGLAAPYSNWMAHAVEQGITKTPGAADA